MRNELKACHCGGKAYGMHEDMGEGVHGGTDWHAVAACTVCGTGIDLYAEDATDPAAGEDLEREAVAWWNRRIA